jgi:hypothetical protein
MWLLLSFEKKTLMFICFIFLGFVTYVFVKFLLTPTSLRNLFSYWCKLNLVQQYTQVGMKLETMFFLYMSSWNPTGIVDTSVKGWGTMDNSTALPCHIAEIDICTPSIPDYWANVYFKTNFNH